MSLMAVRTDSVVATIAKVADRDEGTAMTLLELALYEALCDEADRARPRLEREYAQVMAKRAEGALETVAKRYAQTEDPADREEMERLADQLEAIHGVAVELAKADRDYHGREQGERNPRTGQFQRKGVRGALLNLLGIGTGQGGDNDPQEARGNLQNVAGEGANAYTRLRTLGSGLMATQHPGATAVGTAARVVADIGPEAQSALEPGIRRSAYRYRGTEKRPSAAVQREAATLAALAHGEFGDLPPRMQDQAKSWVLEVGEAGARTTGSLAAQQDRPRSGASTLTPAAGALSANPINQAESEDQARMRLLSDFGALSLRKQVPDTELARISLAAGKMPPSVGMMFDADGNMVSEAMGFNGDHYLPFDLKNLKRLKGGQYVRTRTTGGLTDEDFYTGLMTGARHITVISNSGVFTAEFDPDLRGGRRYSDKARAMVDRYSKLVDKIGSGELFQQDISRERMIELRNEAMDQASDDPKLAADILKDLQKEERLKARFMEEDEDTLFQRAHDKAQAEKGNLSNAAFQQRRNELFRVEQQTARDKQVRAYKLDGEGYHAAMKALAQEFPYFIREVGFTPMHEYLTSRKALAPGEQLPGGRNSRDLGYTERGGLGTKHDHEGSTNSAEHRTGRKAPMTSDLRTPKAAPIAAPVADGETPQEGAAKPAGGAPQVKLVEPDAPSLEEAAKKAEVRLKVRTASVLSEALGFRGAMGDGAGVERAYVEEDGKGGKHVLPVDSDIAHEQVPTAYADWVGNQFRSTKEYVDFLGDPKNYKHVDALKKTLTELRDISGFDQLRSRYPAEKFDEALRAVDALGGGTDMFAEAAPNPVLAVPDLSSPRPQPMTEVVALKASLKNIEAFARRNKPIAELAAGFQAEADPDKAAADIIRPLAEKITKLIEWGGKKDAKPAGVDASEAQRAAQLAAKPEADPAYRTLRDAQIAWALVKAARMTAAILDQDPVSFGDSGPKAAGVESPTTAAKRGSRVVMHDRPLSSQHRALLGL